MLQKIDLEHQQEQDDRKNRVAYLQAAIGSGKLTPDAMNAAIDELGEITSGGGKKGGDHLDILKKLVGKVSQGSAPTPFEQRVPGEAASRPQTLGDIPAATRRSTAATAAATPGGVDASKAGVTFGADMPLPPKRAKTMKSQEDIDNEEIAFEKRRSQEVTEPAAEKVEERTEARERLRQMHEDGRAEANRLAADARTKQAQERQDARDKASAALREKLQSRREAAATAKLDATQKKTLDTANRKEIDSTLTLYIRTMQSELAAVRGGIKAATEYNDKLTETEQKWAKDHNLRSFLGESANLGPPEQIQVSQDRADNLQRAIDFVIANKNKVTDETSLDQVEGVRDSILAGEGPEISRTEVKAQFPNATDQVIDQFLSKKKSQGWKISNN